MPTDEITIEDLVNWYCEYYNIKLWKDVPGYEGLYQVSNIDGEVKNNLGVVLRGEASSHGGYRRVSLSKNSKHHKFVLNVLVAKTWVPNPLNHPQVNHIDENILNNNAANLEWCDARYNSNWGTRKTRLSKSCINHPRNSKHVIQYTLEGGSVAEYPSTFEAQRVTGIINTSIAKCCNGKQRTAGGYIWKYKKEGA